MSSTPRGRKSPNQNRQSSTDKRPTQPANKPQQSPAHSQPQKEPGLFQRVAETAAGVAVGSAIGNLITSGVSSIFGGSKDSKDTPSSSSPSSASDNSGKVCERERLNFVHCTENETDLAKCEELQKEYKECRVKYNLP